MAAPHDVEHQHVAAHHESDPLIARSEIQGIPSTTSLLGTFESIPLNIGSLPSFSIPRCTSSFIGHVDEDQDAFKGTTSSSGAMFSLVTTAVGVGILALPNAMAKGGWIGGTTCMILAAVFACQCGKMMVQAIEVVENLKGRKFSKMDDVMEACTDSPLARKLVSVAFHFSLVSIGAVLLILLGKNMALLAPILSMRTWVGVCMTVLLPLGYLRNMKFISDMSSIGVICSVGTGLLIVVAALKHIAIEGPSWWEPDTMQILEAPARGSPMLPQGIGDMGAAYCLFVFSFTYALVCPSLRMDMEKPEEMPKVIDRACGIMLLIYVFVAVGGFLAWGDLVEGNVLEGLSMKWCSIDKEGTLPASIKLPNSWACYSSPACSHKDFKTHSDKCGGHGMCSWQPGASWDEGQCTDKFYSHNTFMVTVIAVMVVVNVLLTYLLLLAPVFKGFEEAEPASVNWKPSVLRTGIMLGTMVLALLVPFFSQVVGIISALTVVALQMFCPVIMARGIAFQKKEEITLAANMWHAIIIFFGVMAVVLGLWGSISDLAQEMEKARVHSAS